jgi:hypothetical protein
MDFPLRRYTQKSRTTYSLYFIDPWGASGVPLRRFVAPIISRPRHDVILYMPYYDLHKKSGLLTKANPTKEELQRIIDHDAMFDDSVEWKKIACQIDAAALGWQSELGLEEIDFAMADPGTLEPGSVRLSKDREQVLVRHYKAQLEAQDRDLIVKSIRLPFPDRDQTMYYLYLTTHDGTGALEMNEILAKANLLSNELRQRLRDVTKQSGFVGSLFDASDMDTARIAPGRPSIQDIANDIDERVIKRRVQLTSRRDIYRAVANEPYFTHEVDRAIDYLRKEGKLEYSDDHLTNGTFIRPRTG